MMEKEKSPPLDWKYLPEPTLHYPPDAIFLYIPFCDDRLFVSLSIIVHALPAVDQTVQSSAFNRGDLVETDIISKQVWPSGTKGV